MPYTLGSGTLNITFDALATSALVNLGKQKTFYNQFVSATPILNWLESKTRITEDGGELIKRDVMYGEGQNIMPFSKKQSIPVVSPEYSLPAFFQWKNFAGGIIIYKEDQIILSTADFGVKLNKLISDIDWLLRGFVKKMDYWLCKDGSEHDGMVVTGIDQYVDTNPTTDIVAGLDRAEYEWWRNISENAGNAQWQNVGIWGAADDIPLKVYNYMNYADQLTDKPDAIWSHPDVLEWYEKSLPYYVTINKTDGPVNTGFTALTYKNLPWYVDRNLPTGRLYFLNSSSFEYAVSSFWNLQPTGFIDTMSTGVAAMVNFMILRCAFMCLRPLTNAVIYGFSGY